MTLYQWLTVIITGGGVIAAFVSLQQLVSQVKAAVDANRINRLIALLTLEETIADRRIRLTEICFETTQISEEIEHLKQESKDATPANQKMKSAKLKYEEAKQLYLNSLDRLCYCLLKGLLLEEELRADYRNYINDTVKQFEQDFSSATCPYRNIKEIYEKWARQ